MTQIAVAKRLNVVPARVRAEFIRGFGLAAALAAVSLLHVSAAPAEVRVHGATTVAFGLMNPGQARIEKLAGVGITVLPSSTTRGLADLAGGNADIAMLAEPLESAAEAVNKKTPGLIDP